jgi:hypothetical protein
MTQYFNTAFSLSMMEEHFLIEGVSTTDSEARKFLKNAGVVNVANPNHANTLAAVSQKLGVDVLTDATGGRVNLTAGDEMLVAQVVFPLDVPRDTTEYTNEQLAQGKFSFVIVYVVG